jgi:hypothetical protein
VAPAPAGTLHYFYPPGPHLNFLQDPDPTSHKKLYRYRYPIGISRAGQWACGALSVTKLSLLALFMYRNALNRF